MSVDSILDELEAHYECLAQTHRTSIIWQVIKRLRACRDWPSDGFSTAHARRLEEITAEVVKRDAELREENQQKMLAEKRHHEELAFTRKKRLWELERLRKKLLNIILSVRSDPDFINSLPSFKVEIKTILQLLAEIYRQDSTLFYERIYRDIDEAKICVGLSTREELDRAAAIRKLRLETEQAELRNRLETEAAEKRKQLETEAAENRRLIVNSNHSKFLLGNGIENKGTRRATSKPRVTHCWKCKNRLDNSVDLECCRCNGIICRCGACFCGYSPEVVDDGFTT